MDKLLENPAVQNAIAGIIVIVLTVIGNHLRQYLAAQTAAINDERVRLIVEDLVAAAEKQFGAGAGERKLGYVLAELAARKLQVPRAVIEAAVRRETD